MTLLKIKKPVANSIRVKNSHFFAIAFFVALIESFAFAKFGLFEDLGIYFYFFNSVNDFGLYDAILNFYLQAGKFEPVIFFIFSIQNFIIPIDEFWFCLANLLVINFFYLKASFDLFKFQRHRNIFFACIFALLSYAFFSKALYIWRSLYAFIFIIYFLISKKFWKKFVFIVLAVLTHQTAAIFIVIILFFKLFCRLFGYKYCLLFSFFIALLSGIVVANLQFFSGFVSADVGVFLESNKSHSLQSIIAVLISLFGILVGYKNSEDENKPILISLIFLLVASLVNFENYQFLNRFGAPAIVLSPFIVFSLKPSRLNFATKTIFALTCLASIRLLYLLLTGEFLLIGQ